MILQPIQRIRNIFATYPRTFWTLILATFVDSLGGWILFPFFALYVSREFNVGMTVVGLIFGIFSITGIIGSTIGGALADRWGRKPMVLLGLIMSALSSVWLGSIHDVNAFILVAMITGLFSRIGGPAQQALVADILPEEQRAQGYGIIRVTFNLSATLGPAIGGLLAMRSYLSLFLADAISSLGVALIVFFLLPETLIKIERAKHESFASSFKGYAHILRDRPFIYFFVASALSALVYMQLNSTLSVYLRDIHGIPERGFGYLLSLNAAMVVLFQFFVTRKVRSYPPMLVMTLGTLLYALGFSLYGFTSTYSMFLLAVIIITIGEMMVAPVGQALVAGFARADMRGRYMAFFGFSWSLPLTFAPTLAGLLMDYGDPTWVWYMAGIIGLISTAMYYSMYTQVLRRDSTQMPEPVRSRSHA